jgi:hypothetical protein
MQAAEILDLHPSRVHVFCEAGRLPARKIGKGWALLLSDVQEFKRQERKVGRPARWPMAPSNSSDSRPDPPSRLHYTPMARMRAHGAQEDAAR